MSPENNARGRKPLASPFYRLRNRDPRKLGTRRGPGWGPEGPATGRHSPAEEGSAQLQGQRPLPSAQGLQERVSGTGRPPTLAPDGQAALCLALGLLQKLTPQHDTGKVQGQRPRSPCPLATKREKAPGSRMRLVGFYSKAVFRIHEHIKLRCLTKITLGRIYVGLCATTNHQLELSLPS